MASGRKLQLAGDGQQVIGYGERLSRQWRERRVKRDDRPWGYFEVVADLPDCKVKRIVVHPGGRLSLQRHRRRDEHWFVVCGSAVARVGDRDIALGKGGSLDIPRTSLHRVENTGGEDFVFVEVQIGDYFGEDDIERVADDYGRA